MVGGVDVPDGCHCRLCVRGVLCHVVPADASSAIGDCERGALDHLLRYGEDCTIHCPSNTRHIGLSAAQTYLRKALTHALDEMWHFS